LGTIASISIEVLVSVDPVSGESGAHFDIEIRSQFERCFPISKITRSNSKIFFTNKREGVSPGAPWICA
jgi:hypothetical protein